MMCLYDFTYIQNDLFIPSIVYRIPLVVIFPRSAPRNYDITFAAAGTCVVLIYAAYAAAAAQCTYYTTREAIKQNNIY